MAFETRRLGMDGPLVSTLGLGGNNFGRPGSATASQEGTDAVIHAALECGVTLIDTAEIYGEEGLSETLIGRSLIGRRNAVVLASKFGYAKRRMPGAPNAPRGSREYIRAAIEGSLRRLHTDWVDLYQQHSPDPETPIEVTIAALEELVLEGKIRSYGHTNFSAEQINRAAAAGGRFVSAQNEYSLLNRAAEDSILPAAERNSMGFLPWYPLASGLLTGRYTRNWRQEEPRIAAHRRSALEAAPWGALEALDGFAKARGLSMLDVAFGWLLSRPVLTSVIAGASRPDQVVHNSASAQAWSPSEDELDQIDAIFPRHAPPTGADAPAGTFERTVPFGKDRHVRAERSS